MSVYYSALDLWTMGSKSFISMLKLIETYKMNFSIKVNTESEDYRQVLKMFDDIGYPKVRFGNLSGDVVLYASTMVGGEGVTDHMAKFWYEHGNHANVTEFTPEMLRDVAYLMSEDKEEYMNTVRADTHTPTYYKTCVGFGNLILLQGQDYLRETVYKSSESVALFNTVKVLHKYPLTSDYPVGLQEDVDNLSGFSTTKFTTNELLTPESIPAEDILKVLKVGKVVQYQHEDWGDNIWLDFIDSEWSLDRVLSTGYSYRIKPKPEPKKIKIGNLEIPAPTSALNLEEALILLYGDDDVDTVGIAEKLKQELGLED